VDSVCASRFGICLGFGVGFGGIWGHDTYPRVPSFELIFTVARLARTVVAGLPHQATQRGNRREAIFFEEGTLTL
jgi:hypothetical protein